MPYIKQEERDRFKNLTDAMLCDEILTAGNLNYLITKLCHKFLYEGTATSNPAISKSPNYEKYNAIIGVLECAKLEFYRRKVEIYEDIKIRENGDVL